MATPIDDDSDDDEQEPLACKLAEGVSPYDLHLRVVDMTESDMLKQLNKVRESEGFESDAYVLRHSDSFLGPRRLGQQHLIRLKDHCEFAIESYNTEHGTELKFENVVQANIQTVYLEGMFREFYITFTALAPQSGQESLYQAKVLEPFSYPRCGGQLKLLLCRPKPSSSS